ncbi:MAG: hypothetical protein J6C13_02450 [Clostridia bacterium]|nr:hypothetical protein [Clostridia bacterium]
MNLIDFYNKEKNSYNNEDSLILHVSNTLFNTNTLFDFILTVIKLKLVLDKKAYLVLDIFLKDENKNFCIYILRKLSMLKSFDIVDDKYLLRRCTFEDVFNKLEDIKLWNPENDSSFIEKSNIFLFELEREMLDSKQIIFNEYKNFYKNEDFIVRKINVYLDKNQINKILDNPFDLFMIIMSLSDDKMIDLYNYLFSNTMDIQNLVNKNPYDAKKNLAEFIVNIVYANKQKNIGTKMLALYMSKIAKHKYKDSDFKKIEIDNNKQLIEILLSSNVFKSKSELKRLFAQNAVRTMNNQILQVDTIVEPEIKIKVGKNLLFKLVQKNEKAK